MSSPVSGTPGAFEEVLSSLESSLQVDLIATHDFVTCDPDAPADELLNDLPFDQFPVRDGTRIVGVLERHHHRDGTTARQSMRPLDDSFLIASSAGIRSYISLARDSSYHLVVRRNRVEGIVTPSDLLKLPVRVLLFTLITHLEATMTQTIRRTVPDDGWFRSLKANRRKMIDVCFSELEAQGREPDKLLLSQLCDKRDILAKLQFSGENRKTFVRDLKRLGDLRNDIMHANNYLPDASHLDDLINAATTWISALTD